MTVTQPWAWAIIHGKDVENRTRPTNHRGVLAIHAGKSWDGFGSGDQRVRNLFAPYLTDHQAAEVGLDPAEYPDHFSFGAVIGVVTLTGCHRQTGSCCQPWGERDGDGEVWYWTLADPVMLDAPVCCRGQLGIFTLPCEVAAEVHHQTGWGA